MRTERVWPLAPLLAAFRDHPRPAAPTPRTHALRSARADWLNPAALDTLTPVEFADRAAAFYAATHSHGWHPAAPRAGLLRHAVSHLVRAADPLPVRFARCATPDGMYALPGLGPVFWAAVVKALDPDRHPDWSPGLAAGLARVGLPPDLDPALDAYDRLLREHPDLTAWDFDHFFERVGRMTGRELPWDEPPDPAAAVARLVRTVRVRYPLRKRLREHHRAEQGGPLAPREAGRAAERGGCPAPQEVARGMAVIDDAFSPSHSTDQQAALLADVALALRDRFRVHPLEVPDILALAADASDGPPTDSSIAPRFAGFCTDTFRFLADLADHNEAKWMAGQRGRYRFAVREPLAELCEAVAARYVGPVLAGEYGWDLETDPRPGRAVTSICRNNFGRAGPYQPVLWVTFYPRAAGGRRDAAQLFVRLDPGGVGWGFHLGRGARAAGKRFRANVQEHGDLIFRALKATGALDECRFEGTGPVAIREPADLRAWAVGKDLFAVRHLPADSPILRADDLAGEVLLLFDRLVPLFAAAVEDDPRPVLARRAGDLNARPAFDRAAFRAATGLGDLWLSRTLDLLRLKKQLVLQGVPGTGKTHVARCLARLLTGDRADHVRLVQFHPGYSYEEFVEGIRPQSVEGSPAVSYAVQDGLLPAFAARAAARPADPHVLVIDELNRGNLPRVFGELLFLLEYRDQAITLPYSKREFRLPPNLYLLGTMNPADRSTAGLDQALRRRFSFVDMPPDPAILASWLEAHPPADADETFGPRVVRHFEELNRRLARDLGDGAQVGHSLFMIPGLTADKLRAVWEHHVLPTLADHFAAHPGRLAGYELDKVMDDGRRAKSSRVR